MCGACGGARACYLSGREMIAHPQFHEFYQLMRYHSTISMDLRGEVWVRREEGVIGVQRAPQFVTVWSGTVYLWRMTQALLL